MEEPIIIPRDHDRVVDLPLPPIIRDRLDATPHRCTITLAYVSADGSETPAGSHDLPPLAGRGAAPAVRKRLPAAPSDLAALRVTLADDAGATCVDVAASAPALADFARGAIAFGDLAEEYAPGASALVPIIIRNDSPFSWHPGANGVAVRIDLDGAVREVSLPGPVPAGGTKTFEIGLDVPEACGELGLLGSLLLAPALPFVRGRAFAPARARILVADEVSAASDAAMPRCRITITPPAMSRLPGTPISMLAHVHNAGASRVEAADPGGIRLRARWRRLPLTGVPLRDPVTTWLPYPLEPGATCAVALDATVPDEPGDYQVDVIAELIGAGNRLNRKHCDSPPVTITVADPNQVEKAEERLLSRTGAADDELVQRIAYRNWAAQTDTFADAAAMAAETGLNNWPVHPTLAVMLPQDSPDAIMEEARRWLMTQPYPAWRLVRGDQREEADPVGEGSEEQGADLVLHWDPRRGRLADHALLFLAGAFVHDPALACVYADHDQLDPQGRHSRVFLPAPDAFFARAQPQMATILAVRADALARKGISAHDGGAVSQLLMLLPPQSIGHVPHVLFHAYGAAAAYEGAQTLDVGPWRSTKMHDAPGYAVHAALPAPAPRVALIIPTRDRLDLLSACVGSILDRTRYANVEIIIVDNGSQEEETLRYLRWLEREGLARVLRDDGPFNWSRLNNRAAALTDAEILCFLNNDVEVTSEHWLGELVGLAAQPEVGVAGPTLWFPDGRMQHVGVVFSARGAPLHPFRAAPRGTAPFYLRALRTQPAVTGACLVVRRTVFEAVGGFAESFPLGFNDVDFCLRVKETLGLPSVCTPAAELLHKESASRGRLRSDSDHARFLHDLALFEGRHLETAITDRWAATIAHDARRLAPLSMVARKAPGARTAARPLRRMAAPKTAFIHIPKTAGTAVRRVLERALPDGAVLSIGARAVVEGHAGDPATAARLAPMLRDAEILVSHISHGFGDAIGWPCRYATVLRSPRDRVRSHHGSLVAPPNAPLRDTPLAAWSVAELLRKGVIPGNLMLAKILGAAPEPVRWPAIDGRFPRYAGFGLPEPLWRGDMEALAALPDIEPDTDAAKVDAALAVIDRDFVFVGLQEQLDEHLRQFGRMIDVADLGIIPQLNAARRVERPLTDEDVAAIDAYNALDRLLYEAILARPGGLFLANG